MGLPRRNTGVGSHSLLQGMTGDPVTQPGSPTLQAHSLPSGLPGKPCKFPLYNYVLSTMVITLYIISLDLIHFMT